MSSTVDTAKKIIIGVSIGLVGITGLAAIM